MVLTSEGTFQPYKGMSLTSRATTQTREKCDQTGGELALTSGRSDLTSEETDLTSDRSLLTRGLALKTADSTPLIATRPLHSPDRPTIAPPKWYLLQIRPRLRPQIHKTPVG